MFLGRSGPCRDALHAPLRWRETRKKGVVQTRAVCPCIRKSSQDTLPAADCAGTNPAEKKARNPLLGVVCLLTKGVLISVRVRRLTVANRMSPLHRRIEQPC